MTKPAQPLAEVVSRFGVSLKAKLSGKGAAGAPEDQLRAPLEALIADLAAIALFSKAQWFSYRGRDRSRPIIGDRRPPSALGDIQPAGWLAEYTTELLNVLNVLGRLVKLEPRQADLLARICSGPTIPADVLAVTTPVARKAAKRKNQKQGELIA